MPVAYTWGFIMELEQYRQVILAAIQGEVEAKEFYASVGSRTKDAYLKELFEELAAEEANHEKLLSNILNKEVMGRTFFNFEKDFQVAETIDMPEVNEQMDLKDAIGIAMKNEEAAMKNYTALANNCDDEQLKSVFLDLAAMERSHKFKMEKSFLDVAYPEAW
jgi:rubrerythrin